MAGDGYFKAEWIAAHTDRFSVKSSRTINKIVLHCTDGGAVDARVTARNLFAQPKQWNPRLNGGAGGFEQQSAHYIVGRDGSIVQCVLHKDIAWHANMASFTTIGIEHNGRDPAERTLTGVQYWESARLVLWLGKQVGLLINRHTIQGHSEIDRTTSHSSCPQRVLDWETYMLALSENQRLENGHPLEHKMRLWTADG